MTSTPVLFTGAVRGAVVRYHGSQTGCHGDCFYRGPGRLQTVSHGQLLHRVRPESYDVTPIPITDVVRCGRNDGVYHWASEQDPGRAACGNTRLSDRTAALPSHVRTGHFDDWRCDRPACARRWAAWDREIRAGLAALAGGC